MTIVRTVTPAGEAIVILSEAEFERLRDLAEEATDARAAEASLERLRAGQDEILTEDDLDALRRARTPLAFWRVRRGLPLDDLAREAGLPIETVTALEAGTVAPEAAVFERLALILGIEAEDLAP